MARTTLSVFGLVTFLSTSDLVSLLKLGVVQKSDSLYNSPVFYVPKREATDTGSYKISGN